MILDNCGIDYARMLLFMFGFLVYWKIREIPAPSRSSGNTSLLHDYKMVRSMLLKEQTVTSEKTIFMVLFQ